MKKKIEVKISKKTNRTNNALFICAIIFSILFLAIPILLKLPCLQNLIKLFLNRMGPYKASYFEACGAMIGSFLAVISAIWIQNRSEAKQRNDAIKKYATIVYFDIDKFYQNKDKTLIRMLSVRGAFDRDNLDAMQRNGISISFKVKILGGIRRIYYLLRQVLKKIPFIFKLYNFVKKEDPNSELNIIERYNMDKEFAKSCDSGIV